MKCSAWGVEMAQNHAMSAGDVTEIIGETGSYLSSGYAAVMHTSCHLPVSSQQPLHSYNCLFYILYYIYFYLRLYRI
jgi:hypothetical protein